MSVATLCACAALAVAARADVATQRRLAGQILDVVNTPAALRAGIRSAVAPVVDALRAAGAPNAALDEVRAAMQEWAEHDLAWDEIKPQLVDLYVREFSEEELGQLLAFYRTPLGRKALERFPVIFAEGGRIGQQYAESKQPLLNERLEKIADKYGAQRKADAAP